MASRRPQPLNRVRTIIGLTPGQDSMDINAVLRQLYAERERIERIIASLKELVDSRAAGAPRSQVLVGKRRGRKSMGQKERQEVSKRMKNYWERRRGRLEDKSPLD